MAGERIRNYFNSEIAALIEVYKQFEKLIPASVKAGAAHTGEDGRYVEILLTQVLNKYLPKGLEVLTGFIMRPAVKNGSGHSRLKDQDQHSTQLDILIYDSARYPIFERFGNHVIVPPEGVIGIISVKKHLSSQDIDKEIKALRAAARLCIHKNCEDEFIIGPVLALVTMHSEINKKPVDTGIKIYEKIEAEFSHKGTNRYDELPDFIGSLSEWSVIKSKLHKDYTEYIYFENNVGELHMGFQFLLDKILKVYYDKTRTDITKPGFTSFESGRKADKRLGKIEFALVRGR